MKTLTVGTGMRISWTTRSCLICRIFERAFRIFRKTPRKLPENSRETLLQIAESKTKMKLLEFENFLIEAIEVSLSLAEIFFELELFFEISSESESSSSESVTSISISSYS